MVHQFTFRVSTDGRGIYPITGEICGPVSESGINTGICQVFIHHTSASLIFCENADPDVRGDLERFMQRLVPDGDPLYRHVDEGPDDMPAHVRNVLTATSLGFPVRDGRCDLGTWQGVYLWEHRSIGHGRKVTVTLYGE